MKNAHVFQRSTWLAASPDAVYAFHENPENIRQITPLFLQVVHVQAGPIARVDDTFTLDLKIIGVPLQWHGRWAEVEQPGLLVDTALLFPFHEWRHEHRFEPESNGTRMTDTVTYRLPFGLIGRLFGATIFRLQLILMFAGRHRATRAYFSAR